MTSQRVSQKIGKYLLKLIFSSISAPYTRFPYPTSLGIDMNQTCRQYETCLNVIRSMTY